MSERLPDDDDVGVHVEDLKDGIIPGLDLQLGDDPRISGGNVIADQDEENLYGNDVIFDQDEVSDE